MKRLFQQCTVKVGSGRCKAEGVIRLCGLLPTFIATAQSICTRMSETQQPTKYNGRCEEAMKSL